MEQFEVLDTRPENLAAYGVCGYKNAAKQEELRRKIDWYQIRYSEGLRIKTLYSEEAGTQGMIEYVPGEYAWRPVNAAGYMFIHCLFVGFKKVYKGKGLAGLLLAECRRDAREAGFMGIAAVTRKGSFMAGKEFFLKHGFEVADSAPPDFELVVKRFGSDTGSISFPKDWDERAAAYGEGLTIIRSDQCPYSVKNVQAIITTAEEEYGIKARLVELEKPSDLRQSPSPFGTFALIYDGKVIAYHPISNRRFANIMNKIV